MWSLAVAIALVAILVCESAFAQPVACDRPMGSGACLPWGYIDLSARLPGPIYGLSGNGEVLIGKTPNGLYRWDLVRGVQQFVTGLEFGDPTPMWNRNTVSTDGNVIVGIATDLNAAAGDPVERVFRWDVDGNQKQFLPWGATTAMHLVSPDITAGEFVPVRTPSISGDGEIVVGQAWAQSTATTGVGYISNAWPFVWTAGGGVSDAIQLSFPQGEFQIGAVSGDGQTIIGFAGNNLVGGSSNPEGWMWVNGTATLVGSRDPESTVPTAVSPYTRVGRRRSKGDRRVDQSWIPVGSVSGFRPARDSAHND